MTFKSIIIPIPSTINIFDNFIRQQRKVKQMSQQELSAKAFNKPNRPFICQLENGKTENVTLATIDKILLALDVDVDVIMDEVNYDR